MPSTASAASAPRKRAVNLTLNEDLVAQAKVYTHNLSATMEGLLAAYVATQQQQRQDRQRQADACAAAWNGLHAQVGSFADEHVNL
jgi:antitoxin CcdA